MVPLIVLLAVFAITTTLGATLARRGLDRSLRGRLAMSAMLLVTGPSHFVMTQPMVEDGARREACRIAAHVFDTVHHRRHRLLHPSGAGSQRPFPAA